MAQGFGSRVLAFDICQDPRATALGVEYVTKERLLQEADIVSLHCPLLPSTRHMIDANRCARACSSESRALPWERWGPECFSCRPAVCKLHPLFLSSYAPESSCAAVRQLCLVLLPLVYALPVAVTRVGFKTRGVPSCLLFQPNWLRGLLWCMLLPRVIQSSRRQG